MAKPYKYIRLGGIHGTPILEVAKRLHLWFPRVGGLLRRSLAVVWKGGVALMLGVDLLCPLGVGECADSDSVCPLEAG
jgi:hypothetical protein